MQSTYCTNHIQRAVVPVLHIVFYSKNSPATSTQRAMRSAIRHLVRHGVDALKPQRIETKPVQVGSQYIARPSKTVWRRSVVSKRVANVLRKQAVQEGTYGSFNTDTGVGWDPLWDMALKPNQYEVTRFGGVQPPKKTSRQRSREERAKKIDSNLEARLEKMEEYYTEKEESRVQEKGFEATFKRLARGGPGGGR